MRWSCAPVPAQLSDRIDSAVLQFDHLLVRSVRSVRAAMSRVDGSVERGTPHQARPPPPLQNDTKVVKMGRPVKRPTDCRVDIAKLNADFVNAEGAWREWVLALTAKERNKILATSKFTPQEEESLKIAARTYKQRKSQRQYARRKRALKLATDGTDGSPKSVASPRKKKGANLAGVLHPPPVAPPLYCPERLLPRTTSLYATHTHTHTHTHTPYIHTYGVCVMGARF